MFCARVNENCGEMIDTTQNPEGATPIDPDEAAGLKPGLTTRNELNAFEQANIAQAIAWARTSRILKRDFFTVHSMTLIHKHMFENTWDWAGKFRRTEKNIGIEPYQVQTQLTILCDDGKYWIDKHTYPIDICAVRFHHRLVSIHPFPNGNGRHARLVADLIMQFAGEGSLSWGGSSIDVEGKTRLDYLAALRQADKGVYAPLIDFAKRS